MSNLINGQRLSRLNAMYELSARLVDTLDLDQLLNQVMDSIVELAGAERGIVMLINEQTGEMEQAVARNIEKLSIMSDEGYSRSVMEQAVGLGKGILTNNAQEDNRFSAYQSVVNYQLRSIMCAPLRAPQGVIGAVYVDNRFRSGVFETEDLDLLVAFANQAAMAIRNARLFLRTDKELSRRVDELSKLNRELEAAKNAQQDFVSIITHELRTPMTSIRGYTELVLGDQAGNLSAEHRDLLNVSVRNMGRMELLVRDLSEVNRIQSGQLNLRFSTFDMQAVIQETVCDLKKYLEKRSQRLILDLALDLPKTYADRVRSSQILNNLVTNAAKYSPVGSKIYLATRNDENYVYVLVRDNGFGISAEDQKKLFTQFFRSEDVEVRKQPGWGLGLSIVKMLTEAQGGRILFNSELGRGSLFQFSIPIKKKYGKSKAA